LPIGLSGKALGFAVTGEADIKCDLSGAAGAASDILLSAVGVAKSYSGVPALFDGRIKLRRGSVHALCGGNGAGKSTFLNILVGLQQADAGTVLCKGRAVHYASPAEAFADGVAIITQELSPVLDMTVAENVHLGREPRRASWFVDRQRMISATTSLFERLRMDVDPKARMRSLSVGQIQLVEIAKAIDREGEILIMDEPTSAIGERETDILFEAIRSLQKHGVGIIYVSHRIGDIFSIADSYTVFRDGRFVETGTVANIDRPRLISLIVGRSLGDHEKRPVTSRGEVMLTAKSFCRGHVFRDINLDGLDAASSSMPSTATNRRTLVRSSSKVGGSTSVRQPMRFALAWRSSPRIARRPGSSSPHPCAPILVSQRSTDSPASERSTVGEKSPLSIVRSHASQ
jgi:ABC-type branched-subunit amino acid transport system ATPase component